VRLAFTSKEEAGRFAVAQRGISPGELVLTAAPYALIMNPKFCPSALYLSSRCTPSSVAAVEGGDAGDASRNAKANSKTAKAARKGASGHTAKGETVAATTDAAATAAQLAAPYKDALYGEWGSQLHRGDSSWSSASPAQPPPRWYTTQSTWCAVCFQEIPAGRWLCNRGSLAELALDISWEQEELEKKLRCAEAEAAGKADTDGGADSVCGSDADVQDHEGEEDDEDGVTTIAATKSTLRKLKKPSKSAKTRKDGVVKLKQKLIEKALAQREEIFYERHLQRRSRAERGCPLVRLEGWEAMGQEDPHSKMSGDSSAEAFAQAICGCSGCGVLCYCSQSCWRAHYTQHVESGECAVLRGLYPRLMSEYYSTASGAGAAAAAMLPAVSAQGSVILPGDEPLHWTRSSSESKMLEFQSLLFSALVLARACRSGYQSHFQAIAESQGGITAVAEKVVGTAAAVVRAPLENPQDATATTPSTTVDSVVVPKEVINIQEMRTKAGLTGTVEVVDDDAELRRLATEGDADGTRTMCVQTVHATGEMDCGEGVSTQSSHGDAAGALTPSLYVRLPRYADMAQMETNLCVLSKPRRSTYQRYYRSFLKRVLPTLQLLLLHVNINAESKLNNGTAARQTGSKGADALQVSETYFLRLCAATQCNSFGVYDADANCIAFGVYPEASYFNHSCAPNICRVMHHGGRVAAFYALRTIQLGEPLTISYTDVEQQNSAERRRNLLETYRFFCMCERCSGDADGPVMAVGGSVVASAAAGAVRRTRSVLAVPASMFDKPLLLCAQCAIRGYLRPMPDVASGTAATAAWTMTEVSMRECTVCHCRMVRAVV
jgi:hypothetical protein